jgi:hypothetical protein
MKRPAYRDAVAWIARNDNPGDDHAGNPEACAHVAVYLSVAMVADLFDVTPERIAADVMRLRERATD